MKIAVSSTGQSKEDLLDRRFGRCDYFQIFDTETKQYNVLVNDGVSAEGGAGIAAASQMLKENVNILITGNLGPNAFELLEKSGIKLYSCEVLPVFRAIELFQKNQLSEITLAGKAHHGMH